MEKVGKGQFGWKKQQDCKGINMYKLVVISNRMVG